MRWLNRDPIEEEGGIHIYVFCRNNAQFLDYLGLDWLEDTANFSAGVSDSLSMGITRYVRKAMNSVLFDTWEDIGVNTSSSHYIAGEITEVSVETVICGLGKIFRHGAKKVIRKGFERSARNRFRKK